MRRIPILLLVALAIPPAAAHAAADDPWVAYVANRVVTKQGRQAAVILRADPASGSLVAVSGNGAQGSLFVRPYDLAASPRGDALYVADMGEFEAADGRVIRVDPGTGMQSLVASGGRLVDPSGIAVAPDGTLYVLENVGASGEPEVVRINPATGAQAVVTSGDELCYPFGIVIESAGSLVVADSGSSVSAGVDCANDAGAVVRVNASTGAQSIVSKRAEPWGLLIDKPFGVAVGPTGEILLANEPNAVTNPDAVIAVNPQTGLQSSVSPNFADDVFNVPQRPALLPDGNLVVTDYLLDDQEGGLVHVARPSGAQTVLRQSRQLFNNPLGLEVIVNRPPTAALSFAPARVRGGQPVSFDASGSRDPEGLGLRYEWDLDGDGDFDSAGVQPRASLAFSSSTTVTPRVRVTDPHGAQRTASAGMLAVDAIRPVLSAFGASSRRLDGRPIRFGFRLSERGRVKLTIARALPGRRARGRCVKPRRGLRRRCTRWQRVTVISKRVQAGPGTIRFRGRGKRRRLLAPGRYRARAQATDEVGNMSRVHTLRLSSPRLVR
jgi:DNA-binding beta-propeller fold protein YncE